jgi:L-serine dehydratase
MAMSAITTSLFDLFKVGPGPSSSHTTGPMHAARDFRLRLAELDAEVIATADRLDIYLYGSLSATGKGHGTDRAVVAGLLGWLPETCEPEAFSTLLQEENLAYPIVIGEKALAVSAESIHFERGQHYFPFSNTLILRLRSTEQVLFEQEYYSIGGGFIQLKGEEPGTLQDPPFPYQSMQTLKAQIQEHGLSLKEVILRNEEALSGLSRSEIEDRLDRILGAMHKAVRRGLKATGVLPGFIQLKRKARELHRNAKALQKSPDSFLIFLNAYCLAASEENAAGNMVVTAPTSGASGVIPGLTYLLRNQYSKKRLREGMLAAAAIGFLVKHNASISGAEMGCMGEIGTASAMGAALLCACAGHSIDVIEAAAEIAIEHHLGMTCDPIGGYVQIPCIERNAMGAVKAYNAFLLASSGNHTEQKISLDKVINVMRATGRDMSKKYKETSEAGLALSATEC